MLAGIGARADEVDYTSYLDNGTWYGNTGTYLTGVERYGEEIAVNGTTPVPVLCQTITGLPAGTYTVSFYAVANNAWVGAAVGDNKAQVFANETAEGVTIYDQTGCTLTNYLHTLSCTVGVDGILVYGLQNVATGGNWYVCQGVSLTLTEASGATLTVGETLHSDVAEIAHWATTGNNGTFVMNDWSTETDASNMVTPFCQNWVWTGNTTPTLTTATISHAQFQNLPAGAYEVSMDIRIFSEAGNTIGTGTTFNANGVSEDLDNTTQDGHEGTYSNATEVYGNYKLTCYVGEAGTLDISIQLPDSPTYNWIAWKNLKVVYTSDEMDYSIGTPSVAASCVKPGSEVSITFPSCITPTADATLLLDSSKSITVNSETVTGTLSYDGTTATVTFTMPESIGYGETFIVSVPAGLIYWDDTEVSSEAAGFTLTTPAMADQTGVYLVNAYMMQFLSRGANGGHTIDGVGADVDLYGIPVDIESNSEGKFTIKYLDSQLYVGGPNWSISNASAAEATGFEIAKLDDASYTLNGESYYAYTFASGTYSGTGENYYLYVYVNTDGTSNGVAINGNIGEDNNLSNDMSRAHWLILTKAQRDAVKAANLLAQHIAIAEDYNGTAVTSETEFESFIGGLYSEDVTSFVTDAALTNATFNGSAGWTTTNSINPTSNDYCTEVFQGDTDISQTVSGLEEGIYKITLQGFIRQGSAANCTTYSDQDLSIAFLRANGNYDTNLKTWASGRPTEDEYNTNYATAVSNDPETWLQGGYELFPNSMYQAGLLLDDGAYKNELYALVSNGTLTIEIDCPDYLDAEWMIVKNLTLTRYYTDDTYVYDVTKMLVNPSFEEDVMTGEYSDGDRTAYTVSSVTGWTLPTLSGDWGVSDLMTSAATATDNDFGAPGNPSDGNQMLYIRDAWNDGEDVKLTQELTLPAGGYKIAVDTKCISTTSSTGTLFVDNANTALTINSTMPNDWDTATLRFILEEEATVSVGIEFIFHGTTDVASNGSFLLDNFRLYSENDIVEWTLGANYGTLILPFDADVPSGLKAYTAGTVSNNELPLIDANSISADTPYIIGGNTEAQTTYYFAGVPENTETSYTDNSSILTGTLPAVQTSSTGYLYTEPTTTTVSEGNYVLQLQDEEVGPAFYVVEEGTGITCGSYHCYLNGDAVSGDVKSITFTFGDDVATRIDAVETEETGSEVIYDLSGRRVAKAQKGVYIVNGKKMVIK